MLQCQFSWQAHSPEVTVMLECYFSVQGQYLVKLQWQAKYGEIWNGSYMTWHHVTWRHLTWHLPTSRVTSPKATSQPTALLRLATWQPITWHHTSHHISAHHITKPATTTTPRQNGWRVEGWCTQKIRRGHRTGWWPCAHSTSKFSLWLMGVLWFFLPILPPPARPGTAGMCLLAFYMLVGCLLDSKR